MLELTDTVRIAVKSSKSEEKHILHQKFVTHSRVYVCMTKQLFKNKLSISKSATILYSKMI